MSGLFQKRHYIQIPSQSKYQQGQRTAEAKDQCWCQSKYRPQRCGFYPSREEHTARSCHSLPSGHRQSTHSRTGTIGNTLLTAATQSQDNRSAFKSPAGISQRESYPSHVIGLELKGQRSVFPCSNCSVFCQISPLFYLSYKNKKKLPTFRNILCFKYNLARLVKDDD